MPRAGQYDVQIRVSLTQEQNAFLLSQNADPRQRAATMRKALAFYMDSQSQVMGSRRHFTRTFQARIARLEEIVVSSFLVLVLVLLYALADIMYQNQQSSGAELVFHPAPDPTAILKAAVTKASGQAGEGEDVAGATVEAQLLKVIRARTAGRQS